MLLVEHLTCLSGVASIAALFGDYNCLLLYTNNGSLYTAIDQKRSILIFASEKSILLEILRKKTLSVKSSEFNISKINPNTGLVLDLNTFSICSFSGTDQNQAVKIGLPGNQHREILDLGPGNKRMSLQVDEKMLQVSALFRKNFIKSLAALNRRSKA